MTLSLFKAYDLRGTVPDQFNEDVAYRVGRAYCQLYQPKTVAVGFDIRNESRSLATALAEGLTEGGSDVLDIGLCGTEEVYFATFHNKLDGGAMVTASHNPKGHNGMKLVGPEARPICDNTGLQEIRTLVEENSFTPATRIGHELQNTNKEHYISHLLSYVDPGALQPMRIVANPGNGGAGTVLKLLEDHLPFEWVYLNDTPDGDFPNGVPNPLLVENQASTRHAVQEYTADLGLAWDGDFDRCFFFDHEGNFIQAYYLVGLLAQTLLANHPGAHVVHDPRLIWNTLEQTNGGGGKPVQSRCGHTFMKEVMRERDAIYGGELSAHHYFREFSYCDSGMIPWLLICQLMSQSGKSLNDLVGERVAAYPCSDEINFRVANTEAVIGKIQARYQEDAASIDTTDGISMDMGQWRFNLRASNTEPLLRLNLETRSDQDLLQRCLNEVVALIEQED